MRKALSQLSSWAESPFSLVPFLFMPRADQMMPTLGGAPALLRAPILMLISLRSAHRHLKVILG